METIGKITPSIKRVFNCSLRDWQHIAIKHLVVDESNGRHLFKEIHEALAAMTDRAY